MKLLQSNSPAILASLALALAACGPVYRTNYNLLPPATASGQLCANNVKAMSDVCVANCQMMARSCRSFSTGVSLNYGWSRHDGSFEGGPGREILDDRDCSAVQCESNCLAAARTAHASCGGAVMQQTVCTANCPAPVVPPPPLPKH